MMEMKNQLANLEKEVFIIVLNIFIHLYLLFHL